MLAPFSAFGLYLVQYNREPLCFKDYLLFDAVSLAVHLRIFSAIVFKVIAWADPCTLDS
jgi:hypothetical protein